MKLRKHPGADDDIADAFRWYENQRPGLGDDFIDSLTVAFRVVASRPRSFNRVPVPVTGHEVRRFVMRQYPYSVYYDVRAKDVVVFAVAHQRRQQDYWLNRLSP
jgi:plasmid stabilization system protein ParE